MFSEPEKLKAKFPVKIKIIEDRFIAMNVFNTLDLHFSGEKLNLATVSYFSKKILQLQSNFRFWRNYVTFQKSFKTINLFTLKK